MYTARWRVDPARLIRKKMSYRNAGTRNSRKIEERGLAGTQRSTGTRTHLWLTIYIKLKVLRSLLNHLMSNYT